MSEPRLLVRRPQPPPLLRRGFLRVFLPTALAAVVGATTLLATGTAALPFQPMTVLQGKMASKEDYFNDPEVQRILLRHHIRVHVTSMGSRDVATTGLEGYDFIFPSGQPTAELVQRRTSGNPPKQTYFAQDGAATAPITVLYEHQYLQHQAHSMRTTRQLDRQRVLLYPNAGLMTEPGFISLNPDGRRLGTLLETDPDLRRRAVELGFRVVAADDVPDTPTFDETLARDGVPVPGDAKDDTKALLPASIELFERLIIRVGQCPS